MKVRKDAIEITLKSDDANLADLIQYLSRYTDAERERLLLRPETWGRFLYAGTSGLSSIEAKIVPADTGLPPSGNPPTLPIPLKPWR